MITFVPYRDETGRMVPSWPRCGVQPTDAEVAVYQSYLDQQYRFGLGGLGSDNPFADVSKSASVAASAATAVATSGLLIAGGTAAQVIPIVGQIIGGIAILTGIIAQNVAKAKTIKSNIANVEQQQADLRTQIVDLDKLVVQADASKANILADMQRLGLSGGLGSFSTFLKKTFTPGKYYGNILEDANAEVTRLQAAVDERIAYLDTIKTELTDLYDQLITGKRFQKILLWSGVGVATLGTLYLLNEKYKWIKL